MIVVHMCYSDAIMVRISLSEVLEFGVADGHRAIKGWISFRNDIDNSNISSESIRMKVLLSWLQASTMAMAATCLAD